jgi:DNA-binding GntR family transcriptional regulator
MEHAEIAAAIEASDPVTAGQLARVHFEHARDIRLEQV